MARTYLTLPNYTNALSRSGRTRLARETESWTRLSAAITQIVQLTRA